MSKYEELQQAYGAAHKTFFDQRRAASAIIEALRNGMERYFGSPPTALRLLPYGGSATQVRSCTAEEAVWLDKAGMWRFSVGIDLSIGQSGAHRESGRQTVVLDFLLEADDGAFVGWLSGSTERFALRPGAAPDEYAPLFAVAFQQVLASYRQPGQRFHESQADSTRVIGG